MPAKTKKAKAVNKMDLWLFHFLNESNKTTFLQRTESARAAGYKNDEHNLRVVGYKNYIKLSDKIEVWLDEQGLSENKLKEKLLNLLNAKETRFFQKDGIVTDQREVEALETQRRSLDMAFKIKGAYAPEKHSVSFDDVEKKLLSGRKRANKDYEEKG